MKKAYLSILTLVISVVTMGQNILFDQTSSITNSGTVAQDFETLNDGFDCMGADDFEIPTGETWYLDSIVLYGFYAAQNNDPFTTVSGISLIIYQDNNGAPGTIVYSDTLPPNVDDNQDGGIKYYFTTPLTMTAGTYWVAGAARKDFGGGGGQWYWFRTTTGFGTDFLWQNPGAGFLLGCTSWSNGANCLTVTEDGLAFRVYGCFSPNKPQINDLPNDTTFCEGPVFTLNASSPSSNVTFLWNTGEVGSSIDVETAGYYRVYAFDTTTQCGNYSDIYVDVQPSPDPQLNDTSTCDPSISLNAFVNGTETYLWHDGSTSVFYTVTSNETVSVTVTDNITGCVGADTAVVTVGVPLNPQFLYTSPHGLCEGDTLELGTVVGYAGYNWSTGSTMSSIEITATGTYTVTVSDANGCTETASLDVVVVPLPLIDLDLDTLSNGNVAIKAPSGYDMYEWSTGATSSIAIAEESGEYSVTITDNSGCTNSTSIFLIVVGIDNVLPSGKVTLYPNPAVSEVTVEIPTALTGDARAIVFDVNGKQMMQTTLIRDRNTLDIRSLAPGYYLIKVDTREGTVVQSLMVH